MTAAAIALAMALAPVCLAQSEPVVYSAVNSASYSQGPIAQGSIFTVFGYNLGPVPGVNAASLPLQLVLGGTSIQITVGSRTFDCPLIYASYSQASAIMPSNTPAGDALLVASFRGVAAHFYVPHITVAASSFGIYSIASSGRGPGIITGADYAIKSLARPARPGEVLILWGTGLGPISGSDASPPATTTQFPNVEVIAGNLPAEVSYAGRSGCCAGLDQIAFQMPNSAVGCFVPVTIRIGGVAVSNFVSVPVSTNGESCSNAPPGLPAPLLSRAIAGDPLKFGIVLMGPVRFLEFFGFSFAQGVADRLSALLHRPVAEPDVKDLIRAYRAKQMRSIQQIMAKYGITLDSLDPRLVRTLQAAAGMDEQGVGAAFGTFSALSAFSPQFASLVSPAGTCTVTGDIDAGNSQALSKSADAGPALSFDGPPGPRVLQRISAGVYQTSLGGGFQNATLPSGSYRVAGTGGSGVGPFSASLNLTSTLAWTNKSAISSVARSQPLTVTWTGGPAPGFVLVGAVTEVNGANTAVLCVEDSQRGSFTIPSFALSALPAASSTSGYLFVAPHPFSNPVTITGTDLSYFMNGSVDYKAMEFR